MKTKIAFTLSQEVLAIVDQRAKASNRSELIETALWAYIAQLARDEQNALDLEIINRNADRLNQEAAEVLAYQVIP